MKNYMMLTFIFLGLVLLSAPSVSFAQSQPIDISADTALEWDRKAGQYIARGNAKAVQGDTVLMADLLTAEYDPKGGDASALDRIIARGNVRIINRDAVMTGEQATYNLTTGVARMLGQNLKMETKDTVLTAQDSFEFDRQKNQITAIGDTVARQGTRTLKTAKIVALLAEGENGETEVQTLKAPSRVTIITPKETVVGNRGTYDVVKDEAILTGAVEIKQGQNILKGDRVRVNMATGLSQIFASPTKGQDARPETRVRGRFYTNTEN